MAENSATTAKQQSSSELVAPDVPPVTTEQTQIHAQLHEGSVVKNELQAPWTGKNQEKNPRKSWKPDCSCAAIKTTHCRSQLSMPSTPLMLQTIMPRIIQSLKTFDISFEYPVNGQFSVNLLRLLFCGSADSLRLQRQLCNLNIRSCHWASMTQKFDLVNLNWWLLNASARRSGTRQSIYSMLADIVDVTTKCLCI